MSISGFVDEETYLARMHTGALLNPRIDSTFKALFSQPTEESRDALRSFLEAATERKIRSFELKPNDAPVEFGGQRGVSYDIVCEFDDGLAADIEMQAFNQQYDYGKRAEYQVARLETTYLARGDAWEKAPKVYQITVLDFTYGGRPDGEPVSRYAMRTKDGRELAGSLNVVFIELPKTAGLEEHLDTNTPLENWALFLRDADNPNKQEIIQKLTSKEAGLMQAKKSLSNISANRDLWLAQYRQELYERDIRSGMAAMRREGLEEGRKEGMKEGMKEGERKKALETARILKQADVDEALIAKSTGLTAAEIARL